MQSQNSLSNPISEQSRILETIAADVQ